MAIPFLVFAWVLIWVQLLKLPTLSLGQAERAEKGSHLHVAIPGLRPTPLPLQLSGVLALSVHPLPSRPLAFNPFAPSTNILPHPPLVQQPLSKVPTGFEEKRAAVSMTAKLSASRPASWTSESATGVATAECTVPFCIHAAVMHYRVLVVLLIHPGSCTM